MAFVDEAGKTSPGILINVQVVVGIFSIDLVPEKKAIQEAKLKSIQWLRL